MSTQQETLARTALDDRSALALERAETSVVASARLDFSLNRLFYTSPSDRPPLRIGVLMNGPQAPLFMRKILEDVHACNFAELVCVIENCTLPEDGAARRGNLPARLARSLLDSQRRRQLLYVQYLRTIDKKYRVQPDPLARTDCSDLLEGATRLLVTPLRTRFVDRFTPEAIEQIRAFDLDVILRFGFRILRGDILHVARHGAWSFHHGDSERYRGGPSLLWELMEGGGLSGAVLQRLEESLDAGPVLCHANMASSERPSVSANRFNVFWTTQHFVIQKLYELHRYGQEQIERRTVRHANYLGKRAVYRTPTNTDMARWLGPTLLRKLTRRDRSGEMMHWRIGLRRATTPLYQQRSAATAAEFTWLDSPRGRFWADPFLLEEAGATWLFFEDYDYEAKRGLLACGRLESGQLVDVRTVLQPPFHMSYPHVFKHEGAVWMVPESLQAGAVQLYRATRFPDEWTLERTLIELRAVDPTPFQHAGRWWMFVSPMVVSGHAPITLLFTATQLWGPWTLHRDSPICSDVRWSRSAGAIINDGARILRPSQDCSSGYGHSIWFNEVKTLSDERYEEAHELCFTPDMLGPLAGVHTYNRTTEWEVIDGRALMPRSQVLKI